ncbi:hypothetical protein FRC03_009031 [Tulasnella sp. 419]|nr:hypothetical protein FRC03_009031 [Tulasnella sp. 419]
MHQDGAASIAPGSSLSLAQSMTSFCRRKNQDIQRYLPHSSKCLIPDLEDGAVDNELFNLQRFYTPRLRQLEIGKAFWDKMSLSLDWSHLTRFKILVDYVCIDQNELAWILGQIPLLEELDLREASLDWDSEYRSPTLVYAVTKLVNL